MKRIILFLAFLGCYHLGASQVQDSGSVTIKADPRIDKIIHRRAEFFQIDSTRHGYRLQILSVTDHKEAMLELENFRLKHPEIPVYLKYDSPNFKLRVGDFSDKIEAQYWFVKLRDEYPQLFMVPDKVNPKKIGD